MLYICRVGGIDGLSDIIEVDTLGMLAGSIRAHNAHNIDLDR